MKLLQKTVHYYLIFSVFILLVTIPVFYFAIQNILRDNVDEGLLATKKIAKHKMEVALLSDEIIDFNFLDPNVNVTDTSFSVESDTFETIEIYDTTDKELIPFRLLRSAIIIGNKPVLLQVKTSLVESDELINSIIKVQAILLLLLLTGLFIINRALSKRIWKPFYNTLNKLQNYTIEKHAPLLLPKSTINEFEDLNKSLEELTDRAHKTFLSQKEFAENASHEMQTPLAVFQSKLELLMQTSPLNEEQAQLMDQLADAAQRMQRLNKSLVLLTKIENNQFSDIEVVSITAVIDNFVHQYTPQITQKNITIQTELEGNIFINANKTLIEILVSNLLGNAIRHNLINGVIKVNFTQHSLIIRNTGKAEILNEQKIFGRFQKESGDTNSIGLGLEIARKICTLYGYRISYHAAEGFHGFTVHFTN